MINLFSVKDRQKKEAEEAKQKGTKQTPAELRLVKDMGDLTLPSNMSLHFPEGKQKLTHFELVIKPEEGFYCGGEFHFVFNVPPGYPHDAPKVHCTTKVFHPNLDLDGKICLNILREDWKPVLSISSVIFGLHFLFLDPNPDDPLNKEAAKLLTENDRQFAQLIQQSIHQGRTIYGTYFPPCRAG